MKSSVRYSITFLSRAISLLNKFENYWQTLVSHTFAGMLLKQYRLARIIGDVKVFLGE